MSQVLVFDLSNLTYLGAYALGSGVANHPKSADYICNSATDYMRQIYASIKPDKVLFACDHEHYWRRDIYANYKAHRPNNLIKQQVRAAIKEFKTKNSKLCVEVEGCEADDIIYALASKNLSKLTIASSDQDFVQLLSNKVHLYEPKKKQYIRRPADVKFSLFLKCMRGDISDNIPSAYPYMRTKNLQRAFHNQDEMQRIMQTRLTDGRLVQDNYDLNKKLIDLSLIPAAYKYAAAKVVESRL